ncbi:MAG: hypothetical protein ACI88H_000224 [Cocleimonas sp.]|jgi:hypothetical protein
MEININQSAIKLSPKLLAVLKQKIKEKITDENLAHITVNFRDSSYNEESGGYHPVEISLQRNASNDNWNLLYITDFCYYGHPYPELVKEVDFDFSASTFFMANCSPTPITRTAVKDFYRSWENNFLSYFEYDAFDQIEVSSW